MRMRTGEAVGIAALGVAVAAALWKLAQATSTGSGVGSGGLGSYGDAGNTGSGGLGNTNAQGTGGNAGNTQGSGSNAPANNQGASGSTPYVIGASTLLKEFPNAVINSNGLISTSTGGSTINQIQGNNGAATSTNASGGAPPNTVIGKVGSNQVGINPDTQVYSAGSGFSGAGEYVSSSGAPEFISNQAQFDQQSKAGFLSG